MDRKERLRREIPGADETLLHRLASRPRADVEVIAAGIRQGKRDALAAQADRRRRRKADARAHNWYDQAVLAARDRRLLDSAGRRAAENLEALATLGQCARRIDELTHYAVERLRGSYSDAEIGEALGITRQAVGQRFGARGDGGQSQLQAQELEVACT